MNKTVNIILIILLSILTIAVTGFFIYLLSGGSFNWNFNFNSYSDNLIESKEVDSINEIYADIKNSTVLVETSFDNKIHVELYSENNVEHSIKDDNNKLDIYFHDNEVFNFFKKRDKVLIKIPSDYSDKFNVISTTGDIRFGSFEKLSPYVKITTGDVHADALKDLNVDGTTGDIKINRVNSINCKLTTGDVKIERVNSAEIHGTTGDIKLQEINNYANITLTTGDVKISNFNIKDDSSINVTTGDVKIQSAAGAFIEATNKVGDVKVNNNDRTLEKTLKINVHVGDIKVN